MGILSIVSKSRRKQRKALYTSNIAQRRIIMSSRLSKELRKTWGFKSFPIHSNDIVIVKTGSFKGKEGKVESVNRSNFKVTVEGCTKTKMNGGSVLYPIHPSNVEIKELSLDENRKAALEKKKVIYNQTLAKYAELKGKN